MKSFLASFLSVALLFQTAAPTSARAYAPLAAAGFVENEQANAPQVNSWSDLRDRATCLDPEERANYSDPLALGRRFVDLYFSSHAHRSSASEMGLRTLNCRAEFAELVFDGVDGSSYEHLLAYAAQYKTRQPLATIELARNLQASWEDRNLVRALRIKIQSRKFQSNLKYSVPAAGVASLMYWLAYGKFIKLLPAVTQLDYAARILGTAAVFRSVATGGAAIPAVMSDIDREDYVSAGVIPPPALVFGFGGVRDTSRVELSPEQQELVALRELAEEQVQSLTLSAVLPGTSLAIASLERIVRVARFAETLNTTAGLALKVGPVAIVTVVITLILNFVEYSFRHELEIEQIGTEVDRLCDAHQKLRALSVSDITLDHYDLSDTMLEAARNVYILKHKDSHFELLALSGELHDAMAALTWETVRSSPSYSRSYRDLFVALDQETREQDVATVTTYQLIAAPYLNRESRFAMSSFPSWNDMQRLLAAPNNYALLSQEEIPYGFFTARPDATAEMPLKFFMEVPHDDRYRNQVQGVRAAYYRSVRTGNFWGPEVLEGTGSSDRPERISHEEYSRLRSEFEGARYTLEDQFEEENLRRGLSVVAKDVRFENKVKQLIAQNRQKIHELAADQTGQDARLYFAYENLLAAMQARANADSVLELTPALFHEQVGLWPLSQRTVAKKILEDVDVAARASDLTSGTAFPETVAALFEHRKRTIEERYAQQLCRPIERTVDGVGDFFYEMYRGTRDLVGLEQPDPDRAGAKASDVLFSVAMSFRILSREFVFARGRAPSEIATKATDMTKKLQSLLSTYDIQHEVPVAFWPEQQQALLVDVL